MATTEAQTWPLKWGETKVSLVLPPDPGQNYGTVEVEINVHNIHITPIRVRTSELIRYMGWNCGDCTQTFDSIALSLFWLQSGTDILEFESGHTVTRVLLPPVFETLVFDHGSDVSLALTLNYWGLESRQCT